LSVGAYSAIDFKSNIVVVFIYDLCKGWREVVQLFFPIHDKSKVDTAECV